MARISKDNVNALVSELLKKRTAELREVENEVSIYVESLVVKNTHTLILDAFKKYPNYFVPTKSVQVSGYGFNYQLFYTKNNCVRNCKSSSYHQLIIEEKEAKFLSILQSKVDALKKNIEGIKKELTTLIFSLGTYKKVIETIPESKPFIEKLDPSKFTPMVSKEVSTILNKLK